MLSYAKCLSQFFLLCFPKGISTFRGVTDIPQGEGRGVSSHKYELSEEIPMGLTMKEKQAVTKQLALSYKLASKKREGEDPSHGD